MKAPGHSLWVWQRHIQNGQQHNTLPVEIMSQDQNDSAQQYTAFGSDAERKSYIMEN